MARIAFFTANDAVNGTELWITDGSAEGTRMVLGPGATEGGTPYALTPLGDGRIVFGSRKADGTPALFVSDATAPGTRAIADVSVFDGGFGWSSPPAPLGTGKAIFTGFTAEDGYALWVTDGTSGGTRLVRGFDGPTGDPVPGAFYGPAYTTSAGNGRAVFSVDDGNSGTELWGTDGTAAGTRLLADATPGAGSSSVLLNLAATLPDGRVVFPIDPLDDADTAGFWVSDGTPDGTQQLVSDSSLASFYRIEPQPDGRLLLIGTGGRWLSDGTPEGTTPHAPPPAPSPEPLEFTLGGGEGPYPDLAIGDAIRLEDGRTLYEAQTLEAEPGGWIPPILTRYGNQLWITDGTVSGSRVLPVTASGTLEAGNSADPGDFTIGPGGRILLTAERGSDIPSASGRALFATDGDTLDLLSPGITGIRATLDIGGGQFAIAADENWDRAIWRTDGSASGTQRIIEGGSAIQPLFTADGTRYFAVEFSSFSGLDPVQIWKSDAGAGGLTHVVTIPTLFSASAAQATFAGLAELDEGRYLVMRDDGATGREPWLLDTKAGSFTLVADIAPGSASSAPSAPIVTERSTTAPAPVSTLFDDRVSLETERSAFDLDDYFTDPSGAPLDYQVTGLPGGMSLNPATSRLVATPDVAPGSYPITVTAGNPGGGATTSTFDWEVIDTGRLAIKSTGDWSRADKDAPILSAPGAVVTIGRKDGTPALFRIEDVTPGKGGDVTLDGTRLTVTGALFPEQVKTDRPLMRGTFSVDTQTLEITGFKDNDAARDHRFVGDLVNPTFSGMSIARNSLAFRTDLDFGGDFVAVSTAGAPLKLVAGAGGFDLKNGTGEVTWLPGNLSLDLPGASGMALRFSDIGAFYDNTADALYLQGKAALQWSGALENQFNYAIDAEEKAALTLDLFGEENAANPFVKGDKYLKIFSTPQGIDWDVVGEISYTDAATGSIAPGSIGLRSMKVGLDTVKNLFSGELVVTVPWALKNLDIGAGLGALWAPEPALDSVSLILGGLNWPLAATGVFVQGGKLALEGIATLPKGDISRTYTLEIDGTLGPQSPVTPSPVLGKLTGKITEGSVGGAVKLEFDGQVKLDSKVGYFTPAAVDAVTDRLGAWFGIDTADIEDFELAQLRAGAKLDFAADSYTLSGAVKAFNGALSGTASMNAWWDYTDDADGVPGDFNLDASLSGALSLPASVPLLGGKTLASGRGAWVQSFDGNDKNDHFSVWTTLPTLFGPVTLGLRMTLDGRLGVLGSRDIPKTGSWALDESLGPVVLSAEWERSAPDARLEVIAPDGTVIPEADFAARGGIDLIDDLNDSTSRHVVLDAPEAGTWDLRLVDETGLGSVRYMASEALQSATARFDTVTLRDGGSRIDLGMTADPGDAGRTLVTFFVTPEGAAEETAGRRIGEARLGARDTGLEAGFALDALPPGTYRLHARLEGGDTVPTIVAHDTPLVIAGAPDLGVVLRHGRDAGSDRPLLIVEVSNTGTRTAAGPRLEIEVPAAMAGADPLPDADAMGLAAPRNTFDLPALAPGAAATLRFALPYGALDLPDPVFVEVVTGAYDANMLDNSIRQTLATASLEPPPPDTGLRLEGSADADRLVGGTGDDTLLGYGGADTLIGKGGADRLLGGNGPDVMRGGAGADLLKAGRGADRLLGDKGNDRLIGLGGDDTLDGGAGNDEMIGGAGTDLALFSGRAPVTVDLAIDSAQDTGRGNDRLAGIEDVRSGGGDDRLSGDGGDNMFRAGKGADLLLGRGGFDVLFGQGGRDRLDGGAGFDLLYGGPGADSLRGGAGIDLLDGGTGNDRLSGERGDDFLSGGGGSDVFVFGADEGEDIVYDFEDGLDTLHIASGATRFAELRLGTETGDTILSFADTRIVLVGIDLALIGPDDVSFA